MSNLITMLSLTPEIATEIVAGAPKVTSATCAVRGVSCTEGQTLDAFYKVIDCDTIDITSLTLMGRDVCIAVDDNGFFRTDESLGEGRLPGWVIFDDNGNEARLAGTLVLHGVDEEGGTADCPLNEKHINALFMANRIRPAVLHAF